MIDFEESPNEGDSSRSVWRKWILKIKHFIESVWFSMNRRCLWRHELWTLSRSSRLLVVNRVFIRSTGEKYCSLRKILYGMFSISENLCFGESSSKLFKTSPETINSDAFFRVTDHAVRCNWLICAKRLIHSQDQLIFKVAN